MQEDVDKSTEEEENEEEEMPEVDEEIGVDEFMSLPEATIGRVTKVDYDSVIRDLLGKPAPLTKIKETMLIHSVDKTTVYASEVTRFLNSLGKKGYSVIIRTREGKKWVLIRKKIK